MEKACVKCGTVLVRCVPTTKPAVWFTAVKEPAKLFDTVESTWHLYVCPSCGYVEWYVDKPENFAEA